MSMEFQGSTAGLQGPLSCQDLGNSAVVAAELGDSGAQTALRSMSLAATGVFCCSSVGKELQFL